MNGCALRLGLPVLADPLSGLRFGPDSVGFISGYDTLLRNAKLAGALRPDWVLRFGRAPVSKRLGQWLNGIPSILVDPAGGWSRPEPRPGATALRRTDRCLQGPGELRCGRRRP